MRLPVIQGVIRRRVLVNYRIVPDVMQAQLPARFRPKLHGDHAIAGICLIRLEEIRPRLVPRIFGHSSSSYFADRERFPPGSVEFDCGLAMRNLEHEWHSADDLFV